ncbi:MAG: hypothetical protein ACREDR_30650, partial [Blastocatellia bacterium]
MAQSHTIVLGVDGNVISSDASAAPLNQHNPEEVIGRNFSIFFPPEEVAAGKPQLVLQQALA